MMKVLICVLFVATLAFAADYRMTAPSVYPASAPPGSTASEPLVDTTSAHLVNATSASPANVIQRFIKLHRSDNLASVLVDVLPSKRKVRQRRAWVPSLPERLVVQSVRLVRGHCQLLV
jgi:hypothetical protein